MSPELLIPGLLTVLSLLHEADSVTGNPIPNFSRDQVLSDYQLKAWGGVMGETPRTTPASQQLERAILPWAQAIAETPTLLRPHQGRRGDGMPDAKIVDVRKVPSVAENRIGKFDRLITYQLSPLETFIIVLPDETFTEAAVLDAIKRDLAERGKLVGKTFPV